MRLKPFPIQGDHGESLRQLRGIDDPHCAGLVPAVRRHQHTPEGAWQTPIGIVYRPMVGSEQTIEDYRLCFPTWRITVHLAALHTAVGAEKQISPGNAMPAALRRKPHEFLVGGKAEVVVEPGRMVPYQSHELLIYCSDAFGSASQGIGLRRRQDHTLEAKAWLTIEPGIIEDAGVVESANKISISRQCIVYHRSNNTGQKQRRSDIRYRFQE